MNTSEEDYIVSSSYVTFEITDTSVLDPQFLLLWFKRPEFDRYARFHSLGSARESFDYQNMEEVKIPLPDIKIQRALVDIFRCAEEAMLVALEAKRLSKELCPALMDHIMNESKQK